MHAAQEVCENAHGVAVLTESDKFKDLKWKAIHDNMLKPAFLVDGMRLLNKTELKKF